MHMVQVAGTSVIALGLLTAFPSAASAAAVTPFASSACTTDRFCLWGGSAFSGSFFSTTITTDVAAPTVSHAVWNRTLTAVQVYSNAGGGGWFIGKVGTTYGIMTAQHCTIDPPTYDGQSASTPVPLPSMDIKSVSLSGSAANFTKTVRTGNPSSFQMLPGHLTQLWARWSASTARRLGPDAIGWMGTVYVYHITLFLSGAGCTRLKHA